jgi:redox-sensitive bicupin YhaK (pirin superfamily)
MLTPRRAEQRSEERHGQQEAWLTFSAQAGNDPKLEGFGGLAVLDEFRLAPGGTISGHSMREAELITYLFEGTLAYQDSLGRESAMQAVEFRRMSVGRGVRSSETNSSRTDWTRLFRVGLGSSAGLQCDPEQKRFSVAQRRDGLCLVASAAARAGSLRIRDDALLYSALLRPGQHLVHQLEPGRRAWLHVVNGEVALRDLVLTSGDGVGISADSAGARPRSATAWLPSYPGRRLRASLPAGCPRGLAAEA